MQTPEEFEWSLYQSMDHQMDDWEDQGEVHDLIRARDAEVRADLTWESCGTNRHGQPTGRWVGPVQVGEP